MAERYLQLLERCIVDEDPQACEKLALPVACGVAAVALSLYFLNSRPSSCNNEKLDLPKGIDLVGTQRISSSQKNPFVAIVTGGNKGIGFQICRRILQTMLLYKGATPMVLILTSRTKGVLTLGTFFYDLK